MLTLERHVTFIFNKSDWRYIPYQILKANHPTGGISQMYMLDLEGEPPTWATSSRPGGTPPDVSQSGSMRGSMRGSASEADWPSLLFGIGVASGGFSASGPVFAAFLTAQAASTAPPRRGMSCALEVTPRALAA